MPSVFETAWLARQGTLDTCFGEPFTIQGFARPKRPDGQDDENGRKVADTGWPTISFTGLWTDLAVDLLPMARGHASSDAHMINATQPRVDFATSAVPYRPRVDDRVMRVGTGDVYAVAEVSPSSPGRSVLKLTAQRPTAERP